MAAFESPGPVRQREAALGVKTGLMAQLGPIPGQVVKCLNQFELQFLHFSNRCNNRNIRDSL